MNYDQMSPEREKLSSIMVRLCDTVGNEPLAKIFGVTASAISKHNGQGTGPLKWIREYFLSVYATRYERANVRELLKDVANYLFNPCGLKATFIPEEVGTLRVYHECIGDCLKTTGDVIKTSAESLADGIHSSEEIQREIDIVEDVIEKWHEHKTNLLYMKSDTQNREAQQTSQLSRELSAETLRTNRLNGASKHPG